MKTRKEKKESENLLEKKANELRKTFKRTVDTGLDPTKAMNVNLEEAIQLDQNGMVFSCVTKLVYPLSDNPHSFLTFTKDGRVKLVTESKEKKDTFKPVGPDELLEKVAKISPYYKS